MGREKLGQSDTAPDGRSKPRRPIEKPSDGRSEKSGVQAAVARYTDAIERCRHCRLILATARPKDTAPGLCNECKNSGRTAARTPFDPPVRVSLDRDHRLRAGMDPIPLGAHLISPRLAYSHHGIYVGERWVVHATGKANSLLDAKGPVKKTSLQTFLGKDGTYYIREHSNSGFSGERIAQRALDMVNDDNYSFSKNNCEHLCELATEGMPVSHQVRKAEALGSLTRDVVKIRPGFTIGAGVVAFEAASTVVTAAATGAILPVVAVAASGAAAIFGVYKLVKWIKE